MTPLDGEYKTNVSPIEAVAVAWPAVPPLHRIVWPAQAIVPGVPPLGWKVVIFTDWPTARLLIVIVVVEEATNATVQTLSDVQFKVAAVAGADPVTVATVMPLTHSVMVRPVLGRSAAASARKVGAVGPAEAGPANTRFAV